MNEQAWREAAAMSVHHVMETTNYRITVLVVDMTRCTRRVAYCRGTQSSGGDSGQ